MSARRTVLPVVSISKLVTSYLVNLASSLSTGGGSRPISILRTIKHDRVYVSRSTVQHELVGQRSNISRNFLVAREATAGFHSPFSVAVSSGSPDSVASLRATVKRKCVCVFTYRVKSSACDMFAPQCEAMLHWSAGRFAGRTARLTSLNFIFLYLTHLLRAPTRMGSGLR